MNFCNDDHPYYVLLILSLCLVPFPSQYASKKSQFGPSQSFHSNRSSPIWQSKSAVSNGFRYHAGKMVNVSKAPNIYNGKIYLFESKSKLLVIVQSALLSLVDLPYQNTPVPVLSSPLPFSDVPIYWKQSSPLDYRRSLHSFPRESHFLFLQGGLMHQISTDFKHMTKILHKI